jgi:hypothetical protein
LAESDTLAKQPILFDRSRLLCPMSPCRERQARRASHEQRNSSEGAFVVRSWIPTGISVTCANQSAACGASAAHETSNKMSAHFPKPSALELPSSKANRCAEDAAASIRMITYRSTPVQ